MSGNQQLDSWEDGKESPMCRDLGISLLIDQTLDPGLEEITISEVLGVPAVCVLSRNINNGVLNLCSLCLKFEP